MVGSAELRFGPGRLAGEPLEGMVARATFAGSKVTIENVDARLTAGHIVGSGTYDTTSKAFDLQGRAEGVQLSRLFALTNQPGLSTVSGTADFNAHAIGNLSESDFSAYQITFDGQGKDVVINGRAAGTLALVGRTENKQLNITLTTGLFGSNPQVVAAKIDLGSEKLAANVETTLNNADLSGLLKMVLPQTTVKISGLATGTLKASGNLLDEDGYFAASGLQGEANFTNLSFRVEDVQLDATSPLIVRFSPSEVTFEKTKFTGPGTNIVLGGTLAVGAGGRQSMTADGQLNLRVLNGLSPDAFLSGTAEVAVRVSGSYERPRLNGTASVGGGSISLLIGNERWTIANVKSLVRFTSNQAQIDSATGTMGGGHVSATGGALRMALVETNFLISRSVSPTPGCLRDESVRPADRIDCRCRVTDGSASAAHSSAVVCRCRLRRGLVFVHSGFSRCSSSNSKSTRSSIALAFAHFVLHFRFYRNHAHVFPGRTGEPLGIVSGLLPRCARRSYAQHLHALAAWPRRDVGGVGVDLPDRFAASTDVCSALPGDERAMVRYLRRHHWNCLRNFHRAHDQPACRETDRSTAGRRRCRAAR